MLFDLTFPNNFYSDSSAYFTIPELQIIILPVESPDIIPPSPLSHSAPTDFVCYLYTFEADVPLQTINRPSLIEVTTESPKSAIERLDFPGTFPNTPFLQFTLPSENVANTTYFAHAHMI